MIYRSEEFPPSREHAAYQAMMRAVREYAAAVHHNPVITWQSIGEKTGTAFRLEQARIDAHRWAS